MIEVQKNNPLHGLKLEVLLTELVEHYDWEVLADAMNLNCFKSNPSIKSSLKFLRKTPWAREKVESFYLYKFKNLPRPDDQQYALPPRERTISLDQQPRSPAVITVSKLNAHENLKSKPRPEQPSDVWDNWKNKSQSNEE
jgi:uncharacterized protein (DUF2132 family)